jgi:hypothetical protein
MSNREILASVLIAQAPNAEWTAGGVDRALELADIFINAGITDLTKLSVKLVTFPAPKFDYALDAYVMTEEQRLAFDYQGRQIDWIGDPNFPYKHWEGTRFAWSAAGRGNVGYHAVFTSNGFQIAPFWGSSSDAGEFRDALKFVGAAALAVAGLPTVGFSAGAFLGSAILGSGVAAAYPGLAAAVGNVALSAAMTGGDIENAIKRAGLSYVGGEAGGFVGSGVTDQTGIATLGQVASIATRAYITGSDPRFAIANTLIQSGASMLSSSDLVSYDAPPAWELLPIPDVEFQNAGDPLPYGDAGDDAEFFEIFGNAPGTPFDSPFFTNPVDLPLLDYSAPPAGALFPVPGVAPGENALFAGSGNIIGTVTQAASQALQLVAAYQKVRKPIEATARRVSANGTVQVANRDGLIHTRSASGQITKRRPPVGEATATIDNSLIVNNGDGTYTLVSPNGAISTQRYPISTAAGGFSLDSIASPENLKYAAFAVGAFVLARSLAK